MAARNWSSRPVSSSHLAVHRAFSLSCKRSSSLASDHPVLSRQRILSSTLSGQKVRTCRSVWRTGACGVEHVHHGSTSGTPIRTSQFFSASTSVRSINSAVASCFRRPSYRSGGWLPHSPFHTAALLSLLPASFSHLSFHSLLTSPSPVRLFTSSSRKVAIPSGVLLGC